MENDEERDIQDALGIKTASIHYHFKTKQDLAKAVFERYLVRYKLVLEKIEQDQEQAEARLDALANLFILTRDDDKLCLCGMYASDYRSLDSELSFTLNRFVEINETWIEKVVQLGINSGELSSQSNPKDIAKIYFSSLEGSTLLAQFKDSSYIREVKTIFLQSLKTDHSS
jgi:TetR/AcrR family transcriptional repressor of nem operon